MEENKITSKNEEMANAGLQFGHKTSKRHPNMDPYIEGVKGTVHIIDLNKTEEKLAECLQFIKKLKEENKIILLVCTKPEMQKIIREIANECSMPYVIHRFLGGMLTNFKVMKERIDYYNRLLEQKESGELERKYTKQERVKLAKEMEGLEKNFGGIRTLERIPDAVFVIDMVKDSLAVKESRMVGIPVVAIADTNADPSLTDCFIPANDDSITSVAYILDKVKEILK